MSEDTLEKHTQNKLQIEQTFAGSLPPPNILEGYEKVQPGFAERIMVMAEKEQENRHKFDKDIIDKTHKESMSGIYLGSFLALVLMLIGAFIIIKANQSVASVIAGTIFGLSGVSGIIISLIKRDKSDD